MVDMKLEVLVLPVTDVDRAKTFYAESAGFRLDVDHQPNDEFRVVQFTPPGSACSVTFGIGLGVENHPIKGIHLIVSDMAHAVADLSGRGVDVEPVRHMGPEGWVDGPDPEHRNYGTYSGFSDPDGNGWVLQEVGYGASREERHQETDE
jgi:catechol 2,3-dioxygenase-like lactoylglutathione lyase family enzyme